MSFKATTKLNTKEINRRFEKATSQTQFFVDNEIIKDSNDFAPQRETFLQSSAINHSKIGEGEVIWNTPYARRLYYNPQFNFSKDLNPKAQGLWFEAAKAQKQKSWLQGAEKLFKSIF